MKELIKFIAINLVENKDAVEVSEEEKDDTIHISLTVAASDMGKVIGKQGRISQAIRTVAKASSEKKVFIEIVSQE